MFTEWLDFILEPLQYAFMVRGIAAAIIVGIVCSLAGTFIVLRGMAFFGSAISHAILPGVAVGYIAGGGARAPVFFWALGTAILLSLGIGFIHRHTVFKEDTTIGIILAGMFALGIAIISTVNSYSVDLVHFLFGDVLAVSSQDLVLTASAGCIVVLAILFLYKELLVLTFDETLAFSLRLPTRLLYYLLLVLVAITTVVSLQTVGIALVLAMLVTPAATAFLLTRHLHTMMLVSAVIGGTSGLIGLYISYYVSISSGPAIVLVTMAFFLAALLYSGFRRVFGRSHVEA